MDKYKIDSHKLIYHPDRVNDWLHGKNIYPIYTEISPTSACNHRCTFCGLDFTGHKPDYLDSKTLIDRLYEMGQLGVKAIMYAGEGEPLLHRDINNIILSTKDAGIDVALTTNGVLLNKQLIDNTLKRISWIKVSIDAGTKETYSHIHRTKEEDFTKVLHNIKYAISVRNEKKLKTTIGIQFLLLPDNEYEVDILVCLAKSIGVDYVVIKPYSQHLLGKDTTYKNIKYKNYYLEEELEGHDNDRFNVIFRSDTMKKWNSGEHNYNKCLALPFWSYIDSKGNVWGCSCYLGDKRFYYGNINNSSFEDIWNSNERKNSLMEVKLNLDVSQCRVNCRMDKINEYLWNLKHSVEHVNFI